MPGRLGAPPALAGVPAPALAHARLLRAGLGPALRPAVSARNAQRPDASRARGRRPAICEVAAGAAAVAGLVARPRRARAEAPAEAQDGDKQKRLLLGDPEVEEIRRVQREFKLYDVKRGKWVSLVDLLQPGELLYDADAICVGELHTSEGDHTVQRLLLDALTYRLFLDLRNEQGVDPAAMKGVVPQNASPKRIAVGVEYFARTQQPVLDDYVYVNKDTKLDEFRQLCDWDTVWQWDWGLYAPLFRFCKLNATKLVGMNLPAQVSMQVSRTGLDSVPDWLRAVLPEVDLSKVKHRRRFEDMMKMPLEDAVMRMDTPADSFEPSKDMDYFYQSQALWDEYMSDTASKYLIGRGGRMVVLAGVNHVWRDAIPDRFEAKTAKAGTPLKAVSVAPWRGSFEQGQTPSCADYLWCVKGPGGSLTVAEAMREQRKRLIGKSRVFPAGYI